MPDRKSVLLQAVEALKMAATGLEWYRNTYPDAVDGSDDEADEQIGAAIAGLEVALAATPSPSLCIAAGEVGERSPKDYAIEHGGYLANSACYLLDCLNELDAARLTHEERDDDASRDDLECAGETAIGARTGLRNAIYEFEKRRDRAALARTPGGEQR